MAKKTRTNGIVWLRRSAQTAVLVLFVYLFLGTTFHPDNQVVRGVTLFFELDPLVLLTTWLGAPAVPPLLFLSLITLGVTLLFGRWFCGWVCPFGTLHNAATSLSGHRAKTKLERGGFSRWQKGKYYILLALVVAVLAGTNIVGWLDPFSFFYRGLATAVYPATNYGLQAAFTWLYNTDPGIGPLRITAVSEPVYEFLRSSFLAVELQPQYAWSLLIGALFIAVVVLNLYRPRFWCRYICPLGAMLGLAGKNPLLRLVKDEASCNDCRLCVADCPGGASPDLSLGWKPSECFYCWNCRSACPHQALAFAFEVPKGRKVAVILDSGKRRKTAAARQDNNHEKAAV